MTALRKIIFADKNHLTIELPEEFFGKELEVLIIPRIKAANEQQNEIDREAEEKLRNFEQFLNKWQGIAQGIDPEKEKFEYLNQKHK